MRMRKIRFSGSAGLASAGLAPVRAAFAALAPWTLAGAALVSFTASAGQHNITPHHARS
jgi:hypothetical protein